VYRTSRGDRELEGAERQLFIESLATLIDQFSDADMEFGIPPFDELQRNQKIAALHLVARGLLCPDQPPPPLTAVLEATVAAIYGHARDMLASEFVPESLDSDENPFGPPWVPESELPTWRQLVLDACRQQKMQEGLPAPDDADLRQWEYPLDFLEQCILWDTDWALSGHLDADPKKSSRAKKQLGIDDDYFVAVPPDPSDAQAARLLAELVELTRDAR
jgi:hypothetical protein